LVYGCRSPAVLQFFTRFTLRSRTPAVLRSRICCRLVYACVPVCGSYLRLPTPHRLPFWLPTLLRYRTPFGYMPVPRSPFYRSATFTTHYTRVVFLPLFLPRVLGLPHDVLIAVYVYVTLHCPRCRIYAFARSRLRHACALPRLPHLRCRLRLVHTRTRVAFTFTVYVPCSCRVALPAAATVVLLRVRDTTVPVAVAFAFPFTVLRLRSAVDLPALRLPLPYVYARLFALPHRLPAHVYVTLPPACVLPPGYVDYRSTVVPVMPAVPVVLFTAFPLRCRCVTYCCCLFCYSAYVPLLLFR